MRNIHVALVFPLLVLCCATPSALGQEPCWNLAHRYCCYILPYWRIPCDVTSGYCQGVVPPPPGGVNEFQPTLIPPEETGAMTAGSFQQVGYYDCVFYAPICNENNQEPYWYCSVTLFLVEDSCMEWEVKTQWSWCPVNP